MKRALYSLALLCVAANSGCTALDLWDEPVVTVESRTCNDDADCDSVRFEIPPELTDACLVPRKRCDTANRQCTVDIQARDSDGDRFRDQGCATVFPQFPPFEADCIDNDAKAFPEADLDGDGYIHVSCGSGAEEDCDDTRFTVRPGASEACDGVVSACVGTTAPAIRPGEDDDGDHHAPVGTTICDDVNGPSGSIASYPKDDCDDEDGFVYPGAPDVCDGRENDCDVSIAPDLAEDADGDGFAPTSAAASACNAELEGSFPTTDCDDANARTFPGAPEFCDRIVNDCDVRTGVSFVLALEDPDLDGYYAGNAACVGAVSSIECNGAATDPTTRQCPPRAETTLLTLPGETYGRILTADFDGNRVDDIIVQRTGATELVLERMTTTGIMGSTIFASGIASATVLTANVDADAAPEILVTSTTGGLTAYDVSGGFLVTAAPLVSAPNPASGALAAGDLDGDGTTDLVYAPTGGPSALDWWEASGVPTTGPALATAPVVDALVLADVDGDGNDDLIVATNATSTLTIYVSDGSHGFGTPTAVSVPSIGAFKRVLAGDFEGSGDGDADLAVAGATGVAIVVTQPGGAYVATPVGVDVSGVALAFGELLVSSIAASDLDSDGRTELLYATFGTDTVAYVDEIVLPGGAHAFAQHPVVTDYEGANVVGYGDLDADGDVDVIGATGTPPGLLSYWRSEFVSSMVFAPHNVDRAFDSVNEVVTSDVDDDARPDILARSSLLKQVTLWRTRDAAATSFDERPLLPTVGAATPTAFAVANAGGTTAKDVVVAFDANPSADHVDILVGHGDGTFEPSTLVGAIDAPTGVVGANLDGVTRDEVVVVTSGTGPAVVAYRSDVDGTVFTQHVIDPTPAPCTSVVVGDVDADGDSDLVASCGAADLRLYVNPGPTAVFSASWAMTQLALGGSGTYKRAALGDLDADGFLDVLAVSTAATLDLIRLGAGANVLDRRVIATGFGAGQLPNALGLLDLDADGDLDIVVSNTTTEIRWLQSVQAAQGRYVSSVFASSRANATSIAIADLDSDGALDIAAAVRNDADVVWWSTGGTPWWNH